MQPILSLENISYSYHNLNGETPALSNINFQVAEGEFLAQVDAANQPFCPLSQVC